MAENLTPVSALADLKGPEKALLGEMLFQIPPALN